MRQPGWREAALSLIAFAIALFLVWQLIPMYGISVSAVLVAPLAALAWRFGLKGALWGSALALPLSMLACLEATHEPMLPAIVSGHLGVLVIACVTGRLRDLSVRIGSELEEHARAVRLLRRGEARNQALLGALPDLIFRLDGSGKVSGASGARGRASSMRSAAYLDQLLPVEAAELLRERVRGVLSSGSPSELEYSVREQAETRDYEARLVKYAPDQALAIVRNVTRQKRLERELIAAKEGALEAARSKTKFLANMSHEIRTPMNGVIGMTHLLLETALGQEQREYAQIIQKSGQSLLLIIDDILDFAKIEAGRLELDKFEFDLHVCVEESIEAFAGQAHVKGIDLGCMIDPLLQRRIVGDPTRLRQVLANVLGNAVKYTEQGRVQLEVSLLASPTSVEGEPGAQGAPARVRFRVRDTGPGVPSELVSRLFKPLLLGENGAGAARDGTGLGLAIARELVQLMDGEIRYESGPGESAVFCFEVQLELAAAEPALRQPKLNRVRVLLVRASDAPKRLLDEQLAALGIQAGYASEAGVVDALREARARQLPYLAVLLEGGRDVTSEERLMATLRRDDALEPVPVVLIQAGEPRTALADELRRSATRVLPWPVRRSELVGCLSALLGRSEQVHALPAALALPARLSARVLVADDNPINQRVAQRTLELLGCSCELVDNGEQAVAAVLASVFDVVLMDCQMPVLDGFEAARQIRAQERGRRTPIVAMTAGMSDSDRERCREVEMDAYLTKPATLEQLRETIAGLLAEPAPPGTAEDKPTLLHEEVLDRAALAELNVLGGGDPEFVRELVRMFGEQAPRYLEVARVALDVGDLAAVGKAAHTMKSSSGYLGARRVAELCQQLEALAKAGDKAAVGRAIEALTAEYDAARHALTQEVG